MERIIMLIDMDYFFAQVEQVKNPELKNKPVVIGADPKQGKGRGVVSTASPEARKFGIRSGMPISRAYRLCKQGIFLPVNFPLYNKVSENIMNISRKYADKFEQASIDEAYLDISSKKSLEEVKNLALKLKKEIYEKEHLTCSIGIGPNKLIAKIAADFQKPNGITIVKEAEIENFLENLPVIKLPGVGPKTNQIMEKINIKTIGDLSRISEENLKKHFGEKFSKYLFSISHGIDNTEVEENRKIKSLSREITFEEDTNDKNLIYNSLKNLVDDLYEEIKNYNFSFKTITIKLRYKNFETHTKQISLKEFKKDKEIILEKGKELLNKFLNDKKIRLIGIRVSNLK